MLTGWESASGQLQCIAEGCMILAVAAVFG
jgi:hypothetical protein